MTRHAQDKAVRLMRKGANIDMVQANEFLKDEKVFRYDGNDDSPSVSVILPTYTRGDNGKLERAIQSVLDQTFEDFELIVVDDGSVDGTQRLVRRMQQNDKRIIYIRNDVNSGMPALRVNQGISHARGKYICYQFDDDVWTRDALSALTEEISKHDEEVVVYGAYTSKLDEEDIVYQIRREFDFASLVKCNFIANNTVIHPRSLCEKHGMYDMHLAMRRLCDWDLWIRYAKRVPFISIDTIVSNVTMNVADSLGKTVTYDINATREIMGHDRNSILNLENFRDYTVDDLSYFVGEEVRDAVYRKHILPWKVKHRELYPQEDIYCAGCQKSRVIVTKTEYDSVVPICVENYLELCKDEYDYIYIPEEQLEEGFFSSNDILILNRAVLPKTLLLLKRVKKLGVTVIYLLDDNILEIYKLGEQFSYIAPDSQMYTDVCTMIREADYAIVFSKGIQEEVSKYNRRIARLNSNIPERFLSEYGSYEEKETFQILFSGSAARAKEFQEIEKDLLRVFENGRKVKFTFWGYLPESFSELGEDQVEYIPYTASYEEYRTRLKDRKFNLLICPLLSNSFTDCKSPIKYVEMCCCSTIGLFSDSPVYSSITDGYNGFKIKKGEKWSDSIIRIMEMPVERKKEVFDNALSDVRKRFTTEVQVDQFRVALRAARCSHALRGRKIMYVSHSGYLAGAENHLFRHALLAKEAGFEVVFAMPEAFMNLNEVLQQRLAREGIETVYLPISCVTEIEDINYSLADDPQITSMLCARLQEMNIGLIHTTLIVSALVRVARKMGIPCVSSLYQTETDYAATQEQREYVPNVVHSDSVLYANKWRDKLGCNVSRCIRSFIPKEFSGKYRKKENQSRYKIVMSGTVQARKGQLETIRAIGMLKDKFDIDLYIFGYTSFFENYIGECKAAISMYNLKDQVHFMGISDHIAEDLRKIGTDMLVCASTFESFPQVILEAMAMQLPVVSTPVAGVPELIGKNNGILLAGYSVEEIAKGIEACILKIQDGTIVQLVEQAQRDVLRECSKQYVSKSLFELYSDAYKAVVRTEACSVGVMDSTDAPVDIAARANNPAFLARAKPVVERAPYVSSEAICLPCLIKKQKKYRVNFAGQSICMIGVIFTAYSDVKGSVSIAIKMKGLMQRTATKRLEDIRFNEWTFFSIDPIHEYCGDAEIVITAQYKEDSGEIGTYEKTEKNGLVYKVLRKLGTNYVPKDALVFVCR